MTSRQMTDLLTLARAVFAEAVAAAHPAASLPAHLPAPPARGRLILLAAGKAGGSMAEVAEAHYLDRLGFPAARMQGLAVARHGYGRPTRVVRMIEAGHPVPDAAGLEASEAALALAESATPDDLVLVLMSGGASANWVAPADGVTLADKQGVTRALLRSGAAIDEINTVRKHLSRIKGGRLARAAAPARVVTLAISDVPGDDPSIIGSGPTVPDPSTLADARAVLARFGVAAPAAVAAALEDPANESPKPDDPVFRGTSLAIIARPADAVAAATRRLEAAGFAVMSLGADVEGEARDVARAQAAQAKALLAQGRKVALLSGGELTVTIRGSGRGGPNQEFALALAEALDGIAGIAAIAADTDGTDGGGGAATDPAGAVVDGASAARARAQGLDLAAHLANNDSTAFFAALGDLVETGPTFTNVNDLRCLLINPAQQH
jgi:hydroxypyruvate reductase